MKGLIQVAGILDAAEADMLAAAGVHQLGFPLRLAVHREDVSEEKAAEIIRHLKPPVTAALITYLDRSEEILRLCRKIGVHTVQLHSDVSPREIARLKSAAPEMFVIKSLIVTGSNLPQLELSLEAYSPCVDAFITDTFDPETGACGATGKTHDWQISRRLVAASPRPVILAGGLSAENVREAIGYVRPAGVDVHTGVEGVDGRKDPTLVAAFVKEAKLAMG